MTAIEPPSTLSIPALKSPSHKRTLARAYFLLALLAVLTPVLQAQAPPSGWLLTWSDEFNGSNGSSPDPAKWTYDIGGGGYGNHELESYTKRAVNAHQQDGYLVITALKETYTGSDGITQPYTSARILTKGIFSQPYGRFEARMKLPASKGIWPAFWLLGSNIDSDPWPKSGEIDIMENIGDPTRIYSTLHGPGYSGDHAISAGFTLPPGESVNTAFHLYSVEWTPTEIKFFFDSHLITRRTPADMPAGAHWAFDHPFFIILNLATGGDWPGKPDQTTTFPQQMLIDYVRVYKPSQTPAAAQKPLP